MSNKVVLIKPKSDYPGINMPLGLLHIATMAKLSGYEIKIIDSVIEGDYTESINRECKDAFAVGITALTPEVPYAIKLSDYVKRNFNLPVIWGGWHATLFSEQVCSDESVDYVIEDEGELSFVELLNALKVGSNDKNIAGLVYKKDGKVIKNNKREFLNMDELAPLDYSLIDIDKYIGKNRIISYQSSRGCPYQCKFCINVVTGNNKGYRAKSPTKIVDDLKYLIDRYGIRYVIFTDDNFFLKKERIEELCNELNKNKINIKWFAECRADYFKDGFIDQSFLKLLEKSGLTRLTIGAESGSSEMLRKIDKDITVQNILDSAHLLKETSIIPGYSFIIGLPDERKRDVMLTLELADKLKSICPQMEYGIATLRAYPRSDLTDELIKRNYIKPIRFLREWQDCKKRQLYIGVHKQPWHFDPGLIYAVSRYSNLAANTYPEKVLKRMLKQIFIPPVFIIAVIIRLAQLRMKHRFFSFQIDLYLYDFINKIKKNILYGGIKRYFPCWFISVFRKHTSDSL